MHHIMNNKTGAFVSALLHTVKYGKPCRFVTDGNVVLKNMRNTYGIDMDDFSVLDANQHKGIEMKKLYEITGRSGAVLCFQVAESEADAVSLARMYGHKAARARFVRAAA